MQPTDPAPPTACGALQGPIQAEPTARVRVWDLPTRLFHWALALAVTAQLATGTAGWLDLHFRIGYAILALLLFRLVWGFVGGRWSRFASFIYRPRALLAYLRDQSPPEHLAGHSPLGSFSVFAMLGLLALQVTTGLMADDEIASAGPLSRFVSNATVELATWWHSTWGKFTVLALIALHLAAISFYVRVKGQTLIRPMIAGDKPAPVGVRPSRDDALSRVVALVVFMVCAGIAVWVASLQ